MKRVMPLARVYVAVCGTCCAWLGVAARAAELLPADRPIAAVVDHYVDANLKAAEASPAPQASNENLIRRLSLDLIGRIPTAAEVRTYVASTASDKRAQLVDRLLASPEFISHQVNEFDTFLMAGGGNRAGDLREYLTQAITENRPWDRIFRELVLAEDTKLTQPFIRGRVRDLDRLTNDVSMIFFGVNISCAQCHDHPLADDWKQDHFYGLKSFFNRTFDNGGLLGEREYGRVSYLTPKGEERQAKLMFLSGQLIDEPKAEEPDNKTKKAEQDLLKELASKKQPPPKPKFSRRAKLVETAMQPSEQRFLARSIVNRLFYRFFGQGLVMPVDQMHSGNPPSHPELLDWLARDMAAHGFDLRRMIHGLVMSHAYSRNSRWESESRPDATLFAVALARPLTPYQLAYSLRVATIDPQAVGEGVKPDDVQRKLIDLGKASRGMASSFVQPDDNFQVSVSESLLFANSDNVTRDVFADGGDRLIGRLKQIKEPREQVETCVWNAFGRAPDDDERKLLLSYLAARSDRPVDALRQLVWALVTSAEFRFNY